MTVEQVIGDEIASKNGLLDETAKPSPEKIIQALDELSRHFVALPVLDSRSIDEIVGYDEFGIPK